MTISTLWAEYGAHGGTVDASSEVGTVTTFEIRRPGFPPSPADDQAKARVERIVAPTPAGSAEMDTTNARILVVDDEPAVANSMKRMLSRAGFEVEVVSDGAAAVARARSGPPLALVISDQTMPGLKGDQVAEQIRAFAPRLPIVIASGYAEVLTEERMATLRIAAVLEKPFSIARLLEIVRAAIATGG